MWDPWWSPPPPPLDRPSPSPPPLPRSFPWQRRGPYLCGQSLFTPEQANKTRNKRGHTPYTWRPYKSKWRNLTVLFESRQNQLLNKLGAKRCTLERSNLLRSPGRSPQAGAPLHLVSPPPSWLPVFLQVPFYLPARVSPSIHHCHRQLAGWEGWTSLAKFSFLELPPFQPPTSPPVVMPVTHLPFP